MKAGLAQKWHKLLIHFTPGHYVNVFTKAQGTGGILTSTGSISGLNFNSVFTFTLNTVPDGAPPSGAIVTDWSISTTILGWGFNYTFTDSDTENTINSILFNYDTPYELEFTDFECYLKDDNTSICKWSTATLSYNNVILQTVTNGSHSGNVIPSDFCFNGVFNTYSKVQVTNASPPTGAFAGDAHNFQQENNFRYGFKFKVSSTSTWDTFPIEFYPGLFTNGTLEWDPFLTDENTNTSNQVCIAAYKRDYSCYVNGSEYLSCVGTSYTIWGVDLYEYLRPEMTITSYPLRIGWEVNRLNISETSLVKQGDFYGMIGTYERYTSDDDRHYLDPEDPEYDPFYFRHCVPVNPKKYGFIGNISAWSWDDIVGNKCYGFIKFNEFDSNYVTPRAYAVPPGTIIIGSGYSNPGCFTPSDPTTLSKWLNVNFPSHVSFCSINNSDVAPLPYLSSGSEDGGELLDPESAGDDDKHWTTYYNTWGNPIWNIVMIDYPYNHSSSTHFVYRVNYQYHPSLTVGSNTKKLSHTKFDLLNANGLSTTWLINDANYCSPWGVRQYKFKLADALAYPTNFSIGSASLSRFTFKQSDGDTTTGSISGATIVNDDGNTILFELTSFTVEPCMATSISKSVTIVATDSNIISFEVFITDFEGNDMKIGDDSGTHTIDRELSSKWASSAYLDSLGTYDVDTGATADNASAIVFSQSKQAAQYGLTSTHTGQYLKIVADLIDEALGFTIDSLTFNQPNLQLAEIVYENSNLCNILFRNGALLRFGTLEYNNTNTPSIKTNYNTAPTIGDLLSFENNFFLGKVATDSLSTKASAMFTSTEYTALSDLFAKNSVAGFTKLELFGNVVPFYINSFSATYPYAQLNSELITLSTVDTKKFVVIPGNTTPSLKNASSVEVLTNLSNAFGWNISYYNVAVECNEGYVFTFSFDGNIFFDIKPFKGFSFTEFLRQVASLSVVNLEASNLNVMLNDGNTLTIRKNNSPVFLDLDTEFTLQSVNSSAKNILGVTGIDDSDNLILKFSKDYSLGNTMTVATSVAQSDSKFIRTDLLVCGYYEIGSATLKLKLYSVSGSSATLISSHTTNITDIKDGSSIRLQDIVINGDLWLSVAYVNDSDEFIYVKTEMHNFTGFA